MREDLISVIIPVYNAEKTIDKCLNSIIKSTYRNIEIIVVDDASTDKTNEIISLYAKKDERIKIYKFDTSSGGPSRGRNLGIKEAKGQWITFVDNDDYIEKEMYNTLLTIAKANTVDIIVSGYYNNHGRIENKVIPKHTGVIERKKMMKFFLEHELTTVWTNLYNKRLLADISFNENAKTADDYLFNFECIYKSKKIYISPECYYHWNNQESSLSHKYNSNKVISSVMEHLSIDNYIYGKTSQMTNEYNSLLLDTTFICLNEIINKICCYDNYDNYKKMLNEIKQLNEFKQFNNNRKEYRKRDLDALFNENYMVYIIKKIICKLKIIIKRIIF